MELMTGVLACRSGAMLLLKIGYRQALLATLRFFVNFLRTGRLRRGARRRIMLRWQFELG